jgi:phosphopantetheinyl transferase
MPLLQKFEIDGDGFLGVWKITEHDDYFLDRLHLFPEENEELAVLSSRKRTEWLASRYLLHELSGQLDRTPCLKDEYGKPYLLDSEFYISMSHSDDRVAVMASKRSCGIDIQILVEKISRIAGKFCSMQEMAFIEEDRTIEYLHFIWGAKECMYKSYGKRNINLKGDMEVFPFLIDKEHIILTDGRLSLPDYNHNYTIHGKFQDGFALVYAIDVLAFDHRLL